MSDEQALTPGSHDVAEPIVIDLGKVKRSKIKELKRGHGALRGQIEQVIDELVGDRDVTPLIIICRKKPRRRGLFDP